MTTSPPAPAAPGDLLAAPGRPAGSSATRSDELHRKVREFARRSLTSPTPEDADGFEALALEIARFQAEHVPGFGRLVERRGSRLDRLATLPAVPVETFRMTRVAVHPTEYDAACFRTSGTTGSAAGAHPFRTLDTYRELTLLWGERALFSAWEGPKTVVALAPIPSTPPTSSLGFMMQTFMETFDGRALKQDARGVPFDVHSGERWIASTSDIDVSALRRAATIARARNEPLFVLATSFALVALLDALEGDSLVTPSRTLVMQTGGFKGRSREIPADKLRAAVARAFRIGEDFVVGEYGMTELTSQLYEGTVPSTALSSPPGVYLEPPWLRVEPVDPTTLRPVPDGEVGIARIVDLGNVDSAVAVLTQDLVRRKGPGIELLGRRPGSVPRGCSLPFEGLIRTDPTRPIGSAAR